MIQASPTLNKGNGRFRARLWVLSALLLLMLGGCHSRVNEQQALSYRTTLDQWQTKLYQQREQLDAEAAPLLNLEASLQQRMGLSWYAAHRQNAWVETHVKGYAQHLDAWAKRHRECNSDTEMFIASTDEWLRNLPSSHLSRITAQDLWKDYTSAFTLLQQRQQKLRQQLNGDIQTRLLSLVNQLSGTPPPPPAVAPPSPAAQPVPTVQPPPAVNAGQPQ